LSRFSPVWNTYYSGILAAWWIHFYMLMAVIVNRKGDHEKNRFVFLLLDIKVHISYSLHIMQDVMFFIPIHSPV
jgi:hypothetical protein